MMNRRGFLSATTAALAFSRLGHAAQKPEAKKWAMPGPFPGRVVEVNHPGSMVDGKPNAAAVQAMLRKGIAELSGAPDWVAGWRRFFERGDVVGIKVNPVGLPLAPTNNEVILEVIAGLEAAGVRRHDIIVFDRYRDQFLKAGWDKILPEGVRWDAAAPNYDNIQLTLGFPDQANCSGYDRDVYLEMPLVRPDVDAEDPLARRSHVCQIVSRKINKLINLPVLKDHQSAGVTLALKNLSHGLVNNVSRSHSTPSLNACGTFIPGVCALPVLRSKVVLHVLDGLRGVMQGGPGARRPENVWEQKAIWLATDPVAMDHIGWEIVDAKRVEKGLPTVAYAAPKEGGNYVNRQPEHIEISGALGLGVFDKQKIDLRRFTLS